MARREAQTYGVRDLADRGGRLSARHMRIAAKRQRMVFAASIRQRAPLFSALRRGFRKPRSRSAERGSATKSDLSASSWQDLLVGPEGAPVPPECFTAEEARGRRTPSRLTTPRETPLQRTRWRRSYGTREGRGQVSG